MMHDFPQPLVYRSGSRMKRRGPESESEVRAVRGPKRDTDERRHSTTGQDWIGSVHRTAGNQAVKSLFERGDQRTPDVGEPGDKYEREAKRVSGVVLRGSSPAVATTSPPASAQEPGFEAGLDPEQTDRSTGSGRSFAPPVRPFFESRFGRHFDDVQVHDGQQAAELNRMFGSRALTLGRDIYFGRGNYDPHSESGRRLIAHELTHTVQQGGDSGPDASSGPRIVRTATRPMLMGSELFSSTMEICHRVLRSRVFSVSQGAISVVADADFQHTGGRECGTTEYKMTLTKQRDYWIDQELGTCSFTAGQRDGSYWGKVSPGNYYLTIFTPDTGPYCCLRGDITVAEEPGGSEPGCTEVDDGALDTLHTALDAAGLIPALGAVPDAVNAGIYAIEGDWVGAGVSAAAIVPIFGQGATLTRFGVKVSDEAIERVGREGIENGLKEAKQSAVRSAPTKRGPKNLRRLISPLENPLERSTAKYLKAQGDEVIAEGDVAVRRLLDIPEASGNLTIDFLSVTRSQRFNLTEVKNSLADADIPHAVNQLEFVLGKLSSKFDDVKVGRLEVVVPSKPGGGVPSFRGNYQVSGNQLVRVTDQGTEVIRIGGNVVHVRTLSGG